MIKKKILLKYIFFCCCKFIVFKYLKYLFDKKIRNNID